MNMLHELNSFYIGFVYQKKVIDWVKLPVFERTYPKERLFKFFAGQALRFYQFQFMSGQGQQVG